MLLWLHYNADEIIVKNEPTRYVRPGALFNVQCLNVKCEFP